MVIGFNSHTTFKNHVSVGAFGNYEPKDEHDYYEAREDGILYIDPKVSVAGGWISTDYRKIFALDVNGYYAKGGKYSQTSNEIVISPRLRPNNQMLFIYRFRRNYNNNDLGYTNTEDDGTIIFGKRNQTTIVNTFDIAWTFTNKASLSLRMRHYWSRLLYNQYYELLSDGYLSDDLGFDYYPEGEYDYNFNSFNIDLLFLWNFAPGSEMSISWKNIIDDPDVPMEEKYFTNLNNLFESTLSNSISIKVLYYLDYNYLRDGIFK